MQTRTMLGSLYLTALLSIAGCEQPLIDTPKSPYSHYFTDLRAQREEPSFSKDLDEEVGQTYRYALPSGRNLEVTFETPNEFTIKSRNEKESLYYHQSKEIEQLEYTTPGKIFSITLFNNGTLEMRIDDKSISYDSFTKLYKRSIAKYGPRSTFRVPSEIAVEIVNRGMQRYAQHKKELQVDDIYAISQNLNLL